MAKPLNEVWGAANPITVRASAALPAAGAWDAAPTEIAVPGLDAIVLYVTYTRGAAGGAFDYQVQVSPYATAQGVVQNWFTQSLYAAAALAAGADAQSRLQREYVTYASTGAGAEAFVYGPIELEAVERIRMVCRESGVVGTPGTVHVVAVGV
jgi:hypothetical protein